MEGIEFYAYHGVYEEERIIGGKIYFGYFRFYTVAEKALHNDDLNGTVNYELLYNIAKKHATTRKLIEHLAQKILNDIRKIVNNDDVIK